MVLTTMTLMNEPKRPALTLRDYVLPVRKRWLPVVAVALVITAIVSVYYARRPITYTASTKVYIGPQSNPAVGVGESEPAAEAVANQAALLTSTETAAVVAKKIGYTGPPAGLAGSVTATPSATTNFLSITTVQPSAVLAEDVANAYAQEFITENSSQQVAADNQDLKALRTQLKSSRGPQAASQRASVEAQIQQLQLVANDTVGNATQVDVARGASATKVSPVKYGVLALLGSLIGGILLAYLFERMDPRFKSIHDAEVAYGHPVLATVTTDPRIEYFVAGRPGLSPRTRESFRDLRVALDLNSGERPYRTILVTSAVPAEGKSTVSRNLALAMSESERRVLLLDADLRKPRLHETLGVKSSAGLSDLLAGRLSREEVTMGIEMAIPGLRGKRVETEDQSALAPGFRAVPFMSFIPAGPSVPNPPAVIGSETFSSLVNDLKEAYDVVVIDSTPVVAVSDAIPIIKQVDAVILVVRNATDSRSALRATDLISRVPGANIVGLVINDVEDAQVVAYGYGYGYGYRYRSAEAAAAEERETAGTRGEVVFDKPRP